MKQRLLYLVIAALVAAGSVSYLSADAAKEVAEQKKQMMDDIGGGELVAEAAREKFNKPAGSKKKSCSSCHGVDGKGGKGLKSLVGSHVPGPRPYSDLKGKVADQDLRVKSCMTMYQGVKAGNKKARKKMRKQVVAYSMYVASLSNGMRLNPKAPSKMSPAEKALHDRGERLWNHRTGKRDFSCNMCHVKYAGKRIRLQGLLDLKKSKTMRYFPSYRFGKNKAWTAADRIRGCFKQMKLKPKPPLYKKDVIALQMYMWQLSKGGKVKAPGLVR